MQNYVPEYIIIQGKHMSTILVDFPQRDQSKLLFSDNMINIALPSDIFPPTVRVKSNLLTQKSKHLATTTLYFFLPRRVSIQFLRTNTSRRNWEIRIGRSMNFLVCKQTNSIDVWRSAYT